MTVKLSPVFNDAQLDSSGNPYTGAKLFTYAAGSTTKQTAYQDSAGLTQHTNPIVLNSRGEPPAPIWLTAGSTYKLYLTTPTDSDPPVTSVRVIDNVSGVNDTTSAIDEWIASGQTPTYISATSFSVSGDQTATYMKRRRLKSTNTAGTAYSTAVSSSFGASITTVTVVNDVGGNTLDSGLSAVNLGIVRADNPSIDPDMAHRKGTAVASAATCDIWSVAGDYIHITGNTGPITSLGTAPYAGAERVVIFDSTPTLTHNATTLILPTGRNIVAAAGDRMIVRADTTANMIVVDYIPATGVKPATWGSQVFTGSGTFTTPAGTLATSQFKFTVTGGGGGGAGSGASGASGGGGNAGATAIYYISGLTANLACTVTIGAAGTAGTAGANNGGAGGNSSVVVSAVTVTANGGTGGQASGTAAAANAAAAATATNGTDNINGGQGAIGFPYLATALASGGHGGASFHGGGGAAGPASNVGQAGAAHGAGGGGAGCDAGSNIAGGAGKIGKVIVEWVI